MGEGTQLGSRERAAHDSWERPNNTCYIYIPGVPQNTADALNSAFLAVQELNLLDLHQQRALLGGFHCSQTGLTACRVFVGVNLTHYLLQAHFFCSL